MSIAGRAVRTVLVVDVVDSVRLMEENEEETISRWCALVQDVERVVLPTYDGRLVKSLGDGMLLDFPHVQPAVSAAFAIQDVCAKANGGLSANRQMLVRMGMQVGEVIADEHDIYGRGVNLAARLTTIAGPGEIVVSSGVREHLTPMLDADVEDLGECYLKNVRNPVRAYRLGPPGPRPVIGPEGAVELRPTIAVIPFSARTSSIEHQILGEVLADEVINGLSRAADLNVISRLSTTAFHGRIAAVDEVAVHLNAGYVLSGGYRVSGTRVILAAELVETKSRRIIWTSELKGDIGAVINGDDPLIAHLISGVSTAVITRELERAQTLALPTLEGYTLLMGAISLMHGMSRNDFHRAGSLLQTLIERAPRRAIPQAWLAKWHVLRVWQGWSDDAMKDARLASECTKRALDNDSRCSLAMVIDGVVHTHLLKKFDVAAERFDLALNINPSDSLGWLFKGTLHAFQGDGKPAVQATNRALRLSPLDPIKYFYDSLAATAALSARRYERAIELAQRSLRSNRMHTSTLRVLTIAYSELGRHDDARRTALELLKLEPRLTVRKYLERSPSSGFETGKVWSDALRNAGVPAG